MRAFSYSILLPFIILLAGTEFASGQRVVPDAFGNFIAKIERQMNPGNGGIYVIPTENDYRQWNTIMRLFRAGELDSCREFLAKYDYLLVEMKDRRTGSTYQIIEEQAPLRRGWGTYIYNESHKKRMIVHVNHPVDDPGMLAIGADLFRKSSAEWLMIGGAGRNAGGTGEADAGRARRSIFEQSHEILSDLMHISLSLHTFNRASYPAPVNTSDIVLSNGRTSDEQWGISQISLAFRDTVRAAGIACNLAMFDSGFARLAGGWNTQGTFSNDSLGFGHWLYVELSEQIRSNPNACAKFFAAAEQALDVTGRKVSQQVNKAFGLVSPRVVHLDPSRKIFFPPQASDTYRIISFNAERLRNDTIDLQTGNWLDMLGSSKSLAAISRIDTGNSLLLSRGQKARGSGRPMIARIVETRPEALPAVKSPRENYGDAVTSGDDATVPEPIQVHRIPLEPLLVSTLMPEQGTENMTTFRWKGLIQGKLPVFVFTPSRPLGDEERSVPKFLIPILHNRSHSGTSKFIGVEMTPLLVNEIARLVTEHEFADKDLGLLAEESEHGGYFLRIFPNSQHDQLASRVK